jgi:peptide deformylase
LVETRASDKIVVMAVLEIVTLPDPRLRQKSVPVTEFNEELRRFVNDMQDSMAAAKGIGLAAVQVGVLKRILILDLGDLNADEKYIEGDEGSERRLAERRKVSKLEVYINPEIVQASGDIDYEEGCLSVPGVYSCVKRHETLKLRFQDLEGRHFEVETHGLRSIAIQHELDHLNGVVFTDRLGPMQRMMVLNKYKKLQEQKKPLKSRAE